MIFITGDTHGSFNRFTSDNWPLGRTLTKKDYVIIAGDFGGLWANTKQEKYWLNWLGSRPWTTMFVDGNHENFEMLDKLGTEKIFGDKVGLVRTSNGYIYHLKRGNIYTIPNGDTDVNIFTFGGGLSIDKHMRKENVSWWAREYPNDNEINNAWKNIASEKAVDYIITHVPPLRGMPASSPYSTDYAKLGDLVCHYLNDMYFELRSKKKFKKWYHGHMHYDEQSRDDIVGLYHEILELGTDFIPTEEGSE